MGDPQTSTPADYWVSADGRTTALIHADTGGARWQPSGEGKLISHLTLQARLTDATPQQLELTGQLMVGDQPAADREVTLGRLGETLPTHRLKTVRTDQDGSFTVLIDLESKPRPGGMKFNSYWRVATAFYAGSDAECSTTAFATLSSEA